MEDAVTFLESVKKVYPGITLLLNKSQLLALDNDPNEPFSDQVNEEFLRLSEAYFVTKYNVDSAENMLQEMLMKPRTDGKKINVQHQTMVIKCLKMVQGQIKMIWDAKLEVTEKVKGESGLPRIIRLSRRFKLSDKETLVMIYTLTYQVASQLSKSEGPTDHDETRVYYFAPPGTHCDTLAVCRACECKISEMVDFLDSDREHMQQGIFLQRIHLQETMFMQRDEHVKHCHLLRSTLKFDGAPCKALIGVSLSSSEFLKLEQTHLADIITEEAGNEHYRAHDAHFEATDQTQKDDTERAAGKERETEDEIGDLDDLLRRERELEKKGKELAPIDAEIDESGETSKLTAYKTDMEYLNDHFQLIAQKVEMKSIMSWIEYVPSTSSYLRDCQRHMYRLCDDDMQNNMKLRLKREAEVKLKVYDKKCEKRLALTKKAGGWIPRLERMVQSRGLCPFEKQVLLTLIGFVIHPTMIKPVEEMGPRTHQETEVFSIGDLLRLFCSSLKEQIKHRMFFYKTATLVRESMIIIYNHGLIGDPTKAKVEIDQRMLDFCVGLDTEFSEAVEGSHLYFPKTKFEQVIINNEQKQLILNTVSNFDAYKRCRKKMGLDDAVTYGAGMVMLFHGPPGTGKTMMANALANKLNKKVLLINFPSLGCMSAGENFKFVFREAKINDAILFFDECEAIFETREKGRHRITTLLTQIERHDGLVIMATNRPYDLDEAMRRRIMIAIEFRQPDHLLRKAIWESHIPSQMQLNDDIDLNELSLRFELPGGFIKNVTLTALSIAVSRDGDHPIICQKDLLQGANVQLRGRLKMKDFLHRVVPKVGLDKVIVSDELAHSLKEIVQFEKARSVLFGQWGFGADDQKGITVLFHGQPGTGKSLAAEALGYEVGKPLKVVNCGELLSKWVGESTKNIDAIFEEARFSDAVLVFDEAEGLFGSRTSMTTSTDRYANVDVGVLLYHVESFPGIIILTTNLIDNLDKAFFRRLKFVLAFDIPPIKLRTKIWKVLIPEETPLDSSVDFERLARYEMSGGNIKNAIFRAASRAALRPENDRKLKMEDLDEAADEEMGKTSMRTSFRRQDSNIATVSSTLLSFKTQID